MVEPYITQDHIFYSFSLSLLAVMMLKMLYSLLLLHRIMLAHSYVHLFSFFSAVVYLSNSRSVTQWNEGGMYVEIRANIFHCRIIFVGSFLVERENSLFFISFLYCMAESRAKLKSYLWCAIDYLHFMLFFFRWCWKRFIAVGVLNVEVIWEVFGCRFAGF